jgi:hypothetical protein
MLNVSYVLNKVSNDLYAFVKDINVILIFKNNEWIQLKCDVNEFLYNNELEDITYIQALNHTYGLPVHKVFKKLGFDTYDKDDVPSLEDLFDTIKSFIEERKNFAKYDYYKMEHNKEQNLSYKASELDKHYNTGIYDFLEKHYFEFLKRKLKNEFDYVVIYPMDNDYVIEFDQTILF